MTSLTISTWMWLLLMTLIQGSLSLRAETRKMERADIVMIQPPVLILGRGYGHTSEPGKHLICSMLLYLYFLFIHKNGSWVQWATPEYTGPQILLQNRLPSPNREDEHYPEVARFSHDCRPHMAYYIDDDLIHCTSVVRTDEPGEELTISYFNAFYTQDERQRLAHKGWGFIF
ncbi:Fc.00g016590.m01.CDS01 [Cosmosporella sp. VM-42]